MTPSTTKLFVIAALYLGVAGCSPAITALVTGGPSPGYGVVIQNADGTRRFRFALAANAYSGLIPSEQPEQHEEQRRQALSLWMGADKACPGGYEITSRQEMSGQIVYEGPCK